MQSFVNLAARSLVLFVSLVCLQVLSSEGTRLFAQGFGPDIDLAKVDGKWWSANAEFEPFAGAYIDNGLPYFTQNYTLSYVATTHLINSHVRTSAGNNLMHLHHDRDMGALERTEANLWFDLVFGAQDTPPRTTRVSDATLHINCHSHAFSTLGKGTYTYWTQGTQVFDIAASDDCNPVKKDSVKAGDLLMYNAGSPQEHTTVVHAASWWYGTSTKLRWKMGVSGVYEQTVSGNLDTPRYDINPMPAVGGAVNHKSWTWGPDLAGDDANLWGGSSLPKGQYVWRKKP